MILLALRCALAQVALAKVRNGHVFSFFILVLSIVTFIIKGTIRPLFAPSHNMLARLSLVQDRFVVRARSWHLSLFERIHSLDQVELSSKLALGGLFFTDHVSINCILQLLLCRWFRH